MLRTIIGVTASAALALAVVGSPAGADNIDFKDPKVKKYIVGEKYSDYLVSNDATRSLQDDDFENPAFLWIEQAEEMWGKKDGKAGKACASCHGDVEKMKGVSVTYPKYSKDKKKMQALQHKINECRTERMGAKAWKWESDQMLGMTGLVALQSRGMPMAVDISGPAKPFYEKGREFYFQRRGQLDIACSHCHVDNPGAYIRADLLGQGQANGFPTYRLKWQKFGSLHRRFTGCNKNIRAQPYKRGSEEYTNLELYVKWRGNGLPSEVPSVRR